MTTISTWVIGSLPAALGWAVVLTTLPRYLRYRWRGHDRRVATSWHIMALLALALTVEVPAVGAALDWVTRLPNLALWLGNCLILATAHTSDELLAILAGRTEAAQRGFAARDPRLILIVAIVAMASLMAVAGMRSDLPNLQFPVGTEPVSLAWYELVSAATLGYIAVRFMGHGVALARRCVEPVVKMGVLLTACGAAGAVAYAALLALHGGIALFPPTDATMQLQMEVRWTSLLCRAIAIAVALVGVTLPEGALWVRRAAAHLHAMVVFALLYPLWTSVTEAVPEVVLPTALTWWRGIIQPASMELLLNRRIVEIRDGRRILLAQQPAKSGAAPHDITADAQAQASGEHPSPIRIAWAEARGIAIALGHPNATTASKAVTSSQVPPCESNQLDSEQEHIRHLVLASVCLQAILWRTRAVRRIGAASEPRHMATTSRH